MPAADETIRVLVAGPDGRVGKILVEELPGEKGIEVVGGLRREEPRRKELLAAADILVDFTRPYAAEALIFEAIEAGVRPVSGTSGLTEDTLRRIDSAARERGIGAVWAGNFRVGAALVKHISEILAKFYSAIEIVDIHHARKHDAPSGTALELARSMRKARGADVSDPEVARTTLPGVRGGVEGGVRIHSLRLSGPPSQHKIVFADDQEIITVTHHNSSRGGFAPVVATAIREVMRPGVVGLISGFDAVLGLRHPSLE